MWNLIKCIWSAKKAVTKKVLSSQFNLFCKIETGCRFFLVAILKKMFGQVLRSLEIFGYVINKKVNKDFSIKHAFSFYSITQCLIHCEFLKMLSWRLIFFCIKKLKHLAKHYHISDSSLKHFIPICISYLVDCFVVNKLIVKPNHLEYKQ